MGAFDRLNDIGNIARLRLRAEAAGIETSGAVSFLESPVHTDELFEAKAKNLIAEADVDAIMMKDAGGLLAPDRVRTLESRLKGSNRRSRA